MNSPVVLPSRISTSFCSPCAMVLANWSVRNRPSTQGTQLTIIDQSPSRPESGGTGSASAAASSSVAGTCRASSSEETSKAANRRAAVRWPSSKLC